MVVMITGASGLVGRYLASFLEGQGHRVALLSRRPQATATMAGYRWDVGQNYIDANALAEVECIVHLAGEGIADGHWTAARKRAIVESRTQSCALLAWALRNLPHRVHTVIGASAVGYYGDSGDEILDEGSGSGSDFMARTCVEWEAAYAPIREMGIRCPLVRIGVVLSMAGGALPKMLGPYRFRMAAYFGDGRQYMPWVHIHDLARVFLFILENFELSGIYNAVSPNPVTNGDFAKILGLALGKRVMSVPAPRFALRLLLGEMAAVVLNSNRVLPRALEAADFEFVYPDLLPALRQILQTEGL